MMGAHPEKCPELTELADMLGLGLTPETLEDLLPTEQPLEEVLLWVDACPTCSENLATLDNWQDEVGYPDVSIVARERNRALELWKALQDVPTDELPDHVGDAHLFWAMSVLLQHKSREANRFSMKRAMMLSQIAVHLSDLLPESFYTPRLLADLKARARAYYGNALRLAGRLSDSDRAFESAARHVVQGTGAVLTQAVVLDFLGSLRKDQRRLEEAVDVLRAASSCYESAGRLDLIAKVHLTLGNVEDLRGNREAAVAHLTSAQELIDPQVDLALFTACQHQLTYLLVEAGYFDEAEIRLPLVRRLYQDAADRPNLLNLQWIEARIFEGLEAPDQARENYLAAAEGLAAIGQEAYAGFVKLDLARLECTQKRFDVVKSLASEAYEVFDRSGVSPQRLAALDVFSRAAEAEDVTVELIRSVVRYLSDSSPDRQLPFVSPA